jgi:glutamyl-tRNA(Gln) amidotransferase subunit D
MGYKPGDKVKVITSDSEHTGILMPNQETDAVVIKLSSGYNIGIAKDKLVKIEPLDTPAADQPKKVPPPKGAPGKATNAKGASAKPKSHAKHAKRIMILHTGGTIASKVDYRTGGVIARFSPEELLGMFPELDKIASIDSKLISNMWSEDMRFVHYSLMARGVEEAIKAGFSGVIITHGTDTLGYTAAALAFILENLSIPVILVGAQRSSDRGSSDAGMNLICAAEFIAKTDFSGVAICMHDHSDDSVCAILPATKTRKLHSSRRDAFRAVNAKALAHIDFKTRKITHDAPFPKPPEGAFKVRDKMEDKVAILRCHPNMFPEQFDFYRKEKYRGLVIEGTGLGQAPVAVPNEYCKIHEKNLEAIRNLTKAGIIVTMTSQTIFGRVHPHVYSNAIDLVDAGVLYSEDMLTETAFVKLAWLLGNYPPDEVKKQYGENLRGEINSRIMPDEFLD